MAFSCPGALHPGWLRFPLQSYTCAGWGPALLFQGGEALTLTERVQATSLPWGTRSKVRTTARPCWRRCTDLGGSLETPQFCLDLLALTVQVHQLLYVPSQLIYL